MGAYKLHNGLLLTVQSDLSKDIIMISMTSKGTKIDSEDRSHHFVKDSTSNVDCNPNTMID
jgi:hypothetical protein